MLKKKSLGQNFLRSPHYVAMIADAAHIKKGEQVLEVGPGDGALTQALLERDALVTAIEKDHRLISILQEKFAKEISQKQLTLIEDDILGYDISYLFKKIKYKVVANIPYYITGAVLKKFLSEKNKPLVMVLLVQKEVASRIARDTKESILSLSIKAYGNPHYIKTVPRGAFSPAPTVDSAILAVYDISNKFKNVKEEERFFAIVRAGFAQKRKLLVRNLEKIFGKDSSSILQKTKIPLQARAEDVALEQWMKLSKF